MQWKQQRYGLPSTFISYFALAGLEKDEDVKSSMLHALNLCVKDKRFQAWSLINVTRGSILITLKMAYLRVISQQIGFIPKNYTLFSVSRPVFRYFMPLGPRIFCAPPHLFVFSYVQLSFQVQLISSTIPAIPLGK